MNISTAGGISIILIAYRRSKEVCPKMCQRRFACPCIALHSTAMAKVRGRRKQLMMQ
jgi:hypothetical protein